MQTILVTGAAGFIGWKVCEFLLDEGYRVIGVDNLNDAYDVRLKQWRLSTLNGKAGFTFLRMDVCDREALGKLPEFDAVINLAARAGVRQSVKNPHVYFETNVMGALNLLELCRERGVEKYILASTSSLYGAHNPRPFREDANTDAPLSPYAASKKAAEALCYAYHYLYGLDVTVLRYFTVYGPAGRPDMSLFRFVQWISEGRPVIVYGDGRQERDFTYVDDIARGTIAALKPLGYEVINLGSDKPVVLMDAIHQIEQLVGRKAHIEYHPRHPADVQATWADISKARKLLNWQPEYPFVEGLRQLVNWYSENREWAREIDTLRSG
ncbi:MAG TPA: NAD-dependent epimerase/dehydratase family protein [Chloroflexi bacterium]|nr:NAD-dependent epimerase/dehydratase family protein [Chloroflexota bacterium]